MNHKLKMTEEEAALLVKVLASKAKEIYAWQVATHDTRRRGEYQSVVDLLKKIHASKEGRRWQR